MEHVINELIIENRAEIALIVLKTFGSFILLVTTGWAYTNADWSKLQR